MNEDSRVEQLIKARINQATQHGLPRLLISLYYYNYIDAWPQWKGSHPEDVPFGVDNAREIEHALNRRVTEVSFQGKTLVFQKFKVSEDPIETYNYEYWAYEILCEGRVVLGIEAKHHWTGGAPEFKEITGYVPGAWEQHLNELKLQCDVLARQRAEKTTAEKRQRKQLQVKERLARFGLDDSK